jgi:hypothetical protein
MASKLSPILLLIATAAIRFDISRSAFRAPTSAPKLRVKLIRTIPNANILILCAAERASILLLGSQRNCPSEACRTDVRFRVFL